MIAAVPDPTVLGELTALPKPLSCIQGIRSAAEKKGQTYLDRTGEKGSGGEGRGGRTIMESQGKGERGKGGG